MKVQQHHTVIVGGGAGGLELACKLGTLRTAVLALARFLVRRATPLVKLH